MAQVDYFLKIKGIDGESQDSKHKGEIDLQSFSFGATQSGTMHGGGGGGAGKVSVHDLTILKFIDKASPKLFASCANGEHIGNAVLVCRKAGKDPMEYLTITLTDLLISDYHTSGSSKEGIIPVDEVKLNFSKIEFMYKEQKADGSPASQIKTWYSPKENKGG